MHFSLERLLRDFTWQPFQQNAFLIILTSRFGRQLSKLEIESCDRPTNLEIKDYASGTAADSQEILIS